MNNNNEKQRIIMEETNTKAIYEKPESEIIELELEQPILQASGPDFGDGGYWG